MVNFIVGNGLAPFRCAVPFGHVTEGVKPLPYEIYLSIKSPDVGVTPRNYLSSPSHTKDGLPEWYFYRRERSCAVPFGHVAEGVKPQPYEGWFTRMVNFIVGNGLVPFRCAVPFGHVTEEVKPLPYNSYFSIKYPDISRSYLSSPSHTKDGLPEW